MLSFFALCPLPLPLVSLQPSPCQSNLRNMIAMDTTGTTSSLDALKETDQPKTLNFGGHVGLLAPGITAVSTPRRKPMPRRGHTKSRRGMPPSICLMSILRSINKSTFSILGCHRCKFRKVKCSEQKPKCSQCSKLGYQCEYLDPNAYPIVQAAVYVPPSAPVRTTPGTFDLEDLRFFHHFMVTGFPTLPLNHLKQWRETAAIAYGVRHPINL